MKPEAETTDRRRPFDELPMPQQAGILCNDTRFQTFAARRCGVPGKAFSTTAAAQYLRDCCRIASRRELANSRETRQRFQALRTEFDAWLGKISHHR